MKTILTEEKKKEMGKDLDVAFKTDRVMFSRQVVTSENSHVHLEYTGWLLWRSRADVNMISGYEVNSMTLTKTVLLAIIWQLSKHY